MTDGNMASPLVITCVHGTWGRGFLPRKAISLPLAPDSKPSKRRWFETGSIVREKLEQALETERLSAAFESFEWSGSNSIFERDKAGEDLATLLRSQSQRLKGYRRVVIGHSHGGSVAMRALCRLHRAEDPVDVVTIATPFVKVFDTPGDGWDERGIMLLGSGLLYALSNVALYHTGYLREGLMVLIAAVGLAGLAVIGRNAKYLRWFFWPLFVNFAMYVLSEYMPAETWVDFLKWGAYVVGAIALVVLLNSSELLPTVARWLMGPVGAPGGPGEHLPGRVHRLSQASDFPVVQGPSHRVLVLRGVDDEAALALAAGIIGARLSRVLSASFVRLAAVVGQLFVLSWTIQLVTFLLNTALDWRLPAIPLFHELWDLLVRFANWGFVTLLLLVSVCCAFRSVLGRELWSYGTGVWCSTLRRIRYPIRLVA